jgi:2,3-bisphosphoglycerate-independent phosphoglycerate mutase
LKAILFVADGMADRPIKELAWKTPLEAAERPHLNRLASDGICGIVDPIAPGIPPGSDTSTLAMLGYDPVKIYTGRGTFEALGAGLPVHQGDVAFRCNFATVDDKMIVRDRRAGRIADEDASKLAESLRKVKLRATPEVKLLFNNSVQHRAALVLHGTKLSNAISESDPEATGRKVMQIKPLDKSPEAERTAQITNELAMKFHEILKDHPVNRDRVTRGLQPANMVLLRGAGMLPRIESLQKRFGVRCAAVCAVSLIRGVCKASGMRVLNVKGATGTPQTDYRAKAKAAAKALRANDFVFLHVKATDVAAHDGKSRLKVEVIEKIDSMVGYLLGNIDLGSTYLAVTADHSTSCVTGNHEGDPVPVAIAGPSVRRDDVTEYGERTCAKGGLNRIRGLDLMHVLMNLMGRITKFGA